MPPRTVTIDLAEDTRRRRKAERHFAMYEGEIERPVHGGGMLTGAKGQIMMDEIVSTQAGGRKQKGGGFGEFHLILFRLLDQSVDIQQLAADQLAMVFKAPMEIHGNLTKDPNWNDARRQSVMDSALSRALLLACATGCAMVRPAMAHGFHPGLKVIPGHNFIAIPSPTNPMQPMVVIEFLRRTTWNQWGGPVLVWDVEDPENPRYEKWVSFQALLRQDPKGKVWDYNGMSYPWRYRGAALLPCAIIPGDTKAHRLTPTQDALVMGAIDIMIARTRILWLAYVMAANRVIVMSDKQGSGVKGASTIYGTIIQMHGLGADAKAIVQPSGAVDAEKMAAMTKDRINEWVGRVNRSLRVREEKGAQSGVAIALEMTDLWTHWEQQSTQMLPIAEHVVRTVIASRNYAVAAKMIDAPFVSESDFTVAFRPVWTPEERRRILADIREAIDIGAATPVDYYLALHGMNSGQREEALQAVKDLGAEKINLMLSGVTVDGAMTYGPNGQPLGRASGSSALSAKLDRDIKIGQAISSLAGAGVTVIPNEYASEYGPGIPIGDVTKGPTVQTFIPPQPVADTAARGLELKRFGAKQGSVKLAHRLAAQDPMTLAELRQLDQWHRIHAADSTADQGDGEWGNDGKPSSLYVDFLLHGGVDGRTWAADEVAMAGQPAAVVEPEPVAEEAATEET